MATAELRGGRWRVVDATGNPRGPAASSEAQALEWAEELTGIEARGYRSPRMKELAERDSADADVAYWMANRD